MSTSSEARVELSNPSTPCPQTLGPFPDPRIGARMRQGSLEMLSMADVFAQYVHPGQPALTYEAFLAALLWLSDRLRPPTIAFLSESVR